MSIVRPTGATHYSNVTGGYYKPGVELDWYRWNGELGNWFICGTMPAGSLTPLPAVQVVELEKFDAPMAPCAVHADYPMPTLDPVQTTAYGFLAAPAPQLPTMPEPIGLSFAYYFSKYQFVGSRITCSPPPLDTDQDVLVLVRIGHLAAMELNILEAGFVKEGSLPAEADTQAGKDNVFHSYRKGDMNYIVTTDEAFYQRFSTATELARKYNLMEKSDRIRLFQAVLYGKWWA